MPAYIVAMINITNPDAYDEYRKLAPAAIAKYGGRFLARGGRREVLEGVVPGERVVVVEFESLEKAMQFYRSPEYQAAREKRLGAADVNMLVVEG